MDVLRQLANGARVCGIAIFPPVLNSIFKFGGRRATVKSPVPRARMDPVNWISLPVSWVGVFHFFVKFSGGLGPENWQILTKKSLKCYLSEQKFIYSVCMSKITSCKKEKKQLRQLHQEKTTNYNQL